MDAAGLWSARSRQIDLHNNGTLELGAGAVLGHVAISMGEGVLSNAGQVEVGGGNGLDPAAFGLANPESTGKRTVVNGTPDGITKTRFTIGDGRAAAEFRVLGGQVEFVNHPGASLLVQPRATLALITSDNGSQHMFNNRQAVLNNAGDLTLSGVLQVQGNHAGFTGICNTGLLVVQGPEAGVARLPSSAGPGAGYWDDNAAQLLNLVGGELQGTGTFTYINRTGNPDARYLRLLNRGGISPGGNQPGQLTFVNVNVQFEGGAKPADGKQETPTLTGPSFLRILIAGPSNYSALQVTGDGDSGRFELVEETATTLNVMTLGGALPHGPYRIVTAKAVEGSFAKLQFNGTSSAPYTVSYLPDAVEVVFP